jgi:hypothetical protein
MPKLTIDFLDRVVDARGADRDVCDLVGMEYPPKPGWRGQVVGTFISSENHGMLEMLRLNPTWKFRAPEEPARKPGTIRPKTKGIADDLANAVCFAFVCIVALAIWNSYAAYKLINLQKRFQDYDEVRDFVFNHSHTPPHQRTASEGLPE